MTRDSVLLYRSTLESIREFPKTKQLAALWAVIDYGLDGKEFEGEGLARSAFLTAKPLIDANNRRYENAKKGGAPKGNQNAKKQPKNNQKTTKKQPNVNVNVNANDKDIKKTPLQEAIDDYIEHRKKKRSPMTDRAYELMLKKLEKLSGGREDLKIEILNQSIENGWTGIFELKDRARTAGFNNGSERDYKMDELELKLLATN